MSDEIKEIKINKIELGIGEISWFQLGFGLAFGSLLGTSFFVVAAAFAVLWAYPMGANYTISIKNNTSETATININGRRCNELMTFLHSGETIKPYQTYSVEMDNGGFDICKISDILIEAGSYEKKTHIYFTGDKKTNKLSKNLEFLIEDATPEQPYNLFIK